MGLRKTEKANKDGSFDVRTTVVCDTCKKRDSMGNKLPRSTVILDTINEDTVVTTMNRDGWIVKAGYVPSGSCNGKGQISATGVHTPYRCVCPKCRK